MANGYFSENMLLKSGGVTLGASVTAEQVSKLFHITAQGALNLRVDVVCDTVTAGAGITWKLQTSSGVNKDGAQDWQDFGAPTTVNVAAAGSTSLALNVQDVTNDEAYLPLRPLARIVMTTGAGSKVTVERISVMQAK